MPETCAPPTGDHTPRPSLETPPPDPCSWVTYIRNVSAERPRPLPTPTASQGLEPWCPVLRPVSALDPARCRWNWRLWASTFRRPRNPRTGKRWQVAWSFSPPFAIASQVFRCGERTLSQQKAHFMENSLRLGVGNGSPKVCRQTWGSWNYSLSGPSTAPAASQLPPALPSADLGQTSPSETRLGLFQRDFPKKVGEKRHGDRIKETSQPCAEKSAQAWAAAEWSWGWGRVWVRAFQACPRSP